MKVARLNFSHVTGDYSGPEEKVALVRDAEGNHAKCGWHQLPKNVRAVLVDTKGQGWLAWAGLGLVWAWRG